jgi:TonB family protein
VFDTLLASDIGSGRWGRPSAAAIVLHLGLILGALRGTALSPISVPVGRDTIRLDIGRLGSPRRAAVQRVAPPAAHSMIPTRPTPPPIPLQPLLDPPRLDRSPPLDPVALSGVGSVRDSGETGSALDGASSVWEIKEVDQLPELTHELHPRYPETLRQWGLDGRVQLEYLISAEGRVDSTSIRVLQTTHPDFAASAVEAVRDARFRPARRGGKGVAVLVQQTIRFLSR